MKKLLVGIIIGIFIAFVIDSAAAAVISSGSVSYSNTTVSAALDELFSAVDINNKIGTTSISGIGNGTITGAISSLNSKFYTIYGYSSPGQSNKIQYPSGFDYDNTMIIGARVSTPYNSVVENNYSELYKIDIVLTSDGITISNNEKNTNYTEYVISLMKYR